MIAKLSTGNGFKGCVRYEGKIDMLENMSRFLDAQGLTVDYDAEGNLLINPNQVAWDFRQQVMGYQGDGAIRKPVYHWVLSYSPEDHPTEAQMLQDAHEFLQKIGFDDTQYLIAAHYDKAHQHLHIVSNIVDNNGQRIPTMGLIDKAHKVAADITKKNGYNWGKAATEETIEKAHKPHEKLRYELEITVREALATSLSIVDLQNALKEKNVSCIVRYDSNNKAVGISFATEYNGQLHTFKGSDLDRSLSCGYIKKALKENTDRIAEQVAMKEEMQSYMQDMQTYETIYHPLFLKAKENCDKAYDMYLSSKDKYATGQEMLSRKFEELKAVKSRIAVVENDVQMSRDMKSLVTAIGAAVALINPLAGLAVGLVGRMLCCAENSVSRADRRELYNQAHGIYRDIYDIRQRVDVLKATKNDRLHGYLDAKQEKADLLSEMDTVKKVLEDTRKQLSTPEIVSDIKDLPDAYTRRADIFKAFRAEGSLADVKDNLQQKGITLGRVIRTNMGVEDIQFTIGTDYTVNLSKFGEDFLRQILEHYTHFTKERNIFGSRDRLAYQVKVRQAQSTILQIVSDRARTAAQKQVQKPVQTQKPVQAPAPVQKPVQQPKPTGGYKMH